MTKVDHLKNYRIALPLGVVIALASVAGAVIFVVYAAEWGEKNDINMVVRTADTAGNDSRDKQNLKARTQLSYYATVIALLLLLVFFHGYQLTKMVL
tara:strand:+ start:1013 stop:1303 length:291 start_codon:yes stop_codon:yes gene_type:complete